MIDLNVIRIKNATFYAYHGVMADEQNLGGKFEVDVEMQKEIDKVTEKFHSVFRKIQFAHRASRPWLTVKWSGYSLRGNTQGQVR